MSDSTERGSVTPIYFDVVANRRAQKYSRQELFRRALWDATTFLFRLSPRQGWAWRPFLLRLFGAKIGRNVRIFPTTKIIIPWHIDIGDDVTIGDCAILYALGKIRIGHRTTVSQYAHLCAGTHDYSSPDMRLLKCDISIGDDVWVCADAFVGPDVTVGHGAIVGARAVVVKNVPRGAVMAGNPAKQIAHRDAT